MLLVVIAKSGKSFLVVGLVSLKGLEGVLRVDIVEFMQSLSGMLVRVLVLLIRLDSKLCAANIQDTVQSIEFALSLLQELFVIWRRRTQVGAIYLMVCAFRVISRGCFACLLLFLLHRLQA